MQLSLSIFLCITLVKRCGASYILYATSGSSDSLTLSFYLTAPSDLHYIVLHAGNATFSADQIKNYAQEVSDSHANAHTIVSCGTIRVSSPSQIHRQISNLQPQTKYDLHMVPEVPQSNGVFGAILSTLSAVTHSLPPALIPISFSAMNKTSFAVNVQFQSDKNGTAYFALRPSRMRDELLITAEQIIKQENTFPLSQIVYYQQALREESMTAVISALFPGTLYDVFYLTELSKTSRVISEIHTIKNAFHTHATVPNVRQIACAAANATTDSIHLYFELEHDLPDSDEEATWNAYMIHYKTRELSSFEESNGSISLGPYETLAQYKKKLESRQTIFISQLKSNESYSVTLFAETKGSAGVYGRPQYIDTCRTHASAPEILNSSAVPRNKSATELNVQMTLSGPGIIHYYAIHSAELDSFQRFLMQHKTNPSETLNLSRSVRGSISSEENSIAFTISDLEPDTTYSVTAYTETRGSFGVTSAVMETFLTTKTCRNAAILGIISANAVQNRTNAAQLSLSISEPNDKLYYCLARASEENEKRCVSVPSLEPEFLLNFYDLEPGTAYSVQLITESSECEGIRNNATEIVQFSTFPKAPETIWLELEPVFGSSSALTLRIALSSPGIVHYAVTGKHETVQSPQDILERSDRTSSFTVPNASRVEHCINGLEPNTTYVVHLIVEALTEPRSFIFSDLISRTERTHSRAPNYNSAKAVPKDGRTDAIELQMNLTTFGKVISLIRSFDFHDPRAIRAGNESSADFELYKDLEILPSDCVNATESIERSFNCAKNFTIENLSPQTMYHISLTTQARNESGIYGSFPPPILVKTHALAPDLAHASQLIRAVPGSSSSLELNIRLSEACDIHYILLFRGLGHELFPGKDLEALTAQRIANADNTTAWDHGSISISWAQALTRRSVVKTFDALPADRVFDVCVISQTPNSNGVFFWNGFRHACHRVRTFADYTNHSLLHDEVRVVPTPGKTTSLDVTLYVSKLDNISETQPSRLETYAKRIPFFAITSRDMKFACFREAMEKAERHKRFDHVKTENATHFQLSTRINELRPNVMYRIVFAYETINSGGVFTRLNPFRGQKEEAIAVKTYANAPELVRYAGKAMDERTNAIILSLSAECQECQLSIVHVLLFPAKQAPSLDVEILVRHVQKEPCLRAIRLEIPMTIGSIEHVISDLEPGTLYSVLLYTETDKSNGVLSARAREIRVSTSPPAPTLLHVEAWPRNGTTTELCLSFQLSSPAHVHFMLAASDSLDTNVTSLPTILSSTNLTDSHIRKSVTAQDSHMEILEYQSPGTSYRIFLVTESLENRGIYGETVTLKNVTTFALPPTLMMHSVRPTPRSRSGLTIEGSVNLPGNIHLAVSKLIVRSEMAHLKDTDMFGNRLAVSGSIVHRQSVFTANYFQVNVSDLAESLYNVYLVTETDKSDGIFGAVIEHKNVRLHSAPPRILHVNLSAADGRLDALYISISLTEPGHVHYRVEEQTKLVARGVKTLKSGEGSFVLGSLKEGTLYTVYFSTETLDSAGVFSTWPQIRVQARTHGMPANVLLECALSCDLIQRKSCTEKANVCGECKNGFQGAIGSSNEPCTPKPVAIRIAAIRVHVERESQETDALLMETAEELIPQLQSYENATCAVELDSPFSDFWEYMKA